MRCNGDTNTALLRPIRGSRRADLGGRSRSAYAAWAREHCGWGQAQRSLRPLPSAASEQAWLQYFSPAETGQLQLGWAQRSRVASGMVRSLKKIWNQAFFDAGSGRQAFEISDSELTANSQGSNAGCGPTSSAARPTPGSALRGHSISNPSKSRSALTIKTEGSRINKIPSSIWR